jgi:hypothetical protein
MGEGYPQLTRLVQIFLSTSCTNILILSNIFFSED